MEDKWRWCAPVALGLGALLVLSGCSGAASSSEASQGETLDTGSSALTLPVEGSGGESLIGMVVSLKGDTLTLEAGMGQMGIDSGPGGEMREDMPQGETPPDGEEPPTGDQPTAGSEPSGQPQGEAAAPPDGKEPPEQPEGGGAAPGDRQAEMQTVTLAADIEVLLEVDGEITAGTTADITTGSVVAVTLDGDTAVRVTVRQTAAPDGAEPPKDG